jgi:hypothetical protein
VLREIAAQTSRLLKSAVDSLEYYPQWNEYFAEVDGAWLEMSSVAKPILEAEIVTALRVCGQGKAPGPSGLTVQHLPRADIAHLLGKFFNNLIQLQKVHVMRCKSIMNFIPKGDLPYAGTVKKLGPITLLETVQKIFIKTIFGRIMRVRGKVNLKGAYTAILPGTYNLRFITTTGCLPARSAPHKA